MHANVVEEATPPLLEMHPAAWPQEPAVPRKGTHPGRGYVDVLHRPHVSKAQHGLPGLRVSGCLGSPSHAESAEHKTRRQVTDHLSEVKQGGTSPRETLGHGGTLGNISAG